MVHVAKGEERVCRNSVKPGSVSELAPCLSAVDGVENPVCRQRSQVSMVRSINRDMLDPSRR